jgi:dTDP-4-amino-4,6-dideoxygalactose transaminase
VATLETRTTEQATGVPFVDLTRHHAPLAEDLVAAFERVLASTGFVLGAELERFEAEFAEFCEVGHCVGVGSGTAALSLALTAAGIGAGDEVIVPAHTFIATALAVLHAGATPVLCDVGDDDGLIDPASAAAAIGPRTAAIVAVHLYGQPSATEELCELARRHDLFLLEDAAQAHGARCPAGRVGGLGDAAGFSFYPSKNLGALGDGGAVCTDDEELAARLRRLRNLGQRGKGEHLEAGFNERLDGIQAALLSVKLRQLDAGNANRRRLAKRYGGLLPETAQQLPNRAGEECVYHLFPVRVENRDAVREKLLERGVGAGVHYWPALHQQPPLRNVPRSTGLLNAERWSEQVLTLPMFAELGEHEVEAAAAALTEAIEEAR